MIKAVFFDLDETLVDAMECHREANRKVFNFYGLDYEKIERKTAAEDFLGKRMNEILKTMRDVMGIDGNKIPLGELTAKRQKYFLDLVKEKANLLPGAEEAVRFTKDEGLLIGVVSSGTHRYLDIALEKFNLKQYIDFTVGEEDVEKGKPFPDCYEKAYDIASQKISVLKQECLVVEDSTNGVMAAQAAGLKVCFVPLYKPTKEIFPDFQIDSLEKFGKILK